jgi:PAS domain S-box-containing protein
MDCPRCQAPVAPASRFCALCGADVSGDGGASNEETLLASQRRLRAIFDSVFGFLGVFTPDGKLVDANQAALDAVGLTLEDMRHDPFWNVYCWTFSDAVQDQVQNAMCRAASGETVRYETWTRIKDEQMMMVDVVFCPLRDAKGRVENTLGFAVDITERKQAEQALRKSEDRYRAIVEDQTEMIARWNFVDNVTFVNEAVCRYLDLPPEKILGQSYLAYVHDEDKSALQEHVRSFSPTAPVGSIEIRVVVHGKIRWLQFTTRASFDEHGQLLEFQSVGRDITERQEIEESLRLMQFSIDRAADSVFWVSRTANILYVNEAVCRTLGYTRAELIGECIGKVDPNWSPQMWPGRWEELQRRRSFSFESNQRTKEGVVLDTEVTVNYVQFGGKEMSCAIVRDITERKRAAQTLKMMQFSVDNASDAVFWIASDGRILYVNEAACKRLGYTRDEMLKMRKFDFDPDFPAEAWPAHWADLKNRGSVIFESRNITRDGRIIPIEINSNYVSFGGKEFNFTFSRDITERKRAEEKLRKSEERYTLAEHAINDGIWDWNILSHEIFCSPRWTEILGYDVEELLQEERLNQLDIVHPDDKPEFFNAMQQSLQNKERYSIEIRLRHKDGSYRWVHSRGEPFYDEAGQPVRMLGSITDITERKQAEIQISFLRDQLTHVSRLGVLGELSAGLAHELNQPLTALRLYTTAAEHIGATLESPELHDCLRRIDELAHRAAEIIRRMRSFVSRNLSHRQSVSPNDLVREVLSLLENELRHNHVKTELMLGDNLPHIMVDPIQIQQVLVNLIRNAIDAMNGTEDNQRFLSIRTDRTNDSVRFEIADTGCGIDYTMVDKLFEPFQSFKPKGLGLGLAICRSLIESHQGEIVAKPNPTGGATFHFVLPAANQKTT